MSLRRQRRQSSSCEGSSFPSKGVARILQRQSVGIDANVDSHGPHSICGLRPLAGLVLRGAICPRAEWNSTPTAGARLSVPNDVCSSDRPFGLEWVMSGIRPAIFVGHGDPMNALLNKPPRPPPGVLWAKIYLSRTSGAARLPRPAEQRNVASTFRLRNGSTHMAPDTVRSLSAQACLISATPIFEAGAALTKWKGYT